MLDIRKIIKRIFHNPFFRNVSILASGAIIGQIVVVLASPALTRLFSVEAFGKLSVFISISTLLALFSTGRYELAIVLPEQKDKAIKIVRLILNIAVGVSFFYLFSIFIFKNIFKIEDSAGFLTTDVAYIAPIYILFAAIFSALGYWNQRNKKYKRITFANGLQAIINTFISLILGFMRVESGMIWGLLLGLLGTSLFLLMYEKELINILKENQSVMDVAKEYASFPKYMIFSDLALNMNQQLTPILFSVLYNTTIVGHYSLANRMLRLPNIIITNSVANVFRNDAIDEIRVRGSCIQLYKSTFKKLLFLSLPVYLFLFIISPYAFKLFFGDNWELAGVFARIMCLFLFIEFVATPLNTLFYVRNKQKLLMIIQTLNVLMSGAALFIGAQFFHSANISLILYVVNAVIFNMLLLIFSFHLSKYVEKQS